MILKSILFNFIFYLSIFSLGILFLPFLVSKRLTRIAVKFWAFLVILALEKLIGAKVEFNNKYIFNDKGYIVAANHQSAFDTIFFFKRI
mgnify:CR=1 FL=1